VRSCQKLPPCLTEPVPAGSKTDLLLAKAEPSSGGRTSGITHLRKKKTCVILQPEQGVRTLQTPRLGKKEGEEVLQVPEQRFPCSLWRRPW